MTVSSLLKKLEVPQEGGTLPDRWVNNDIKPIERARRTWGFWTFHNLWVTINVNLSTYLTGSAMIAIGLTWWQSIICIVLGAMISTFFVIVNSTAGGYYHIGFPVANRYVWGMYGSQFVILNRILLSFVWYAVQAWIGGQCTYVCLQAIWPGIEDRIPNHMPASTGMTTAEFVAYVVFMVISLPLIWIRPHKLQLFFWIAVATELVFMVVLLIWALATMGPDGLGSTISNHGSTTIDSTGWTMAYATVSVVGAISAGILNQNDYARFATRPRVVIYGQLAASSFYLVFTGVIGILVTAATQNRFGEPLWNLPTLLSRVIETGGSRSRAAAFFAGIALIVSQWGINVPGNALSGGFDLAATFPRWINIRRGAYITALLSPVVNPWRLLATASTFLNVMSSYGVFLGPMVGLMITSYFIIHRQKIAVTDLYRPESSIYWFRFGVDWRAPTAWLCGVFPSMPGFVAAVTPDLVVDQGWRRLYYVNFLSGCAIAGAAFVALHHLVPDGKVRAFVRGSTMSRRETMRFYEDEWEGGGGDVPGVGSVDDLGVDVNVRAGVSGVDKDLEDEDRVAILELPRSV